VSPVVHVSNLVRRYGDLFAVNDVSFSVGRGELFGLLGPNGAGKSTLIRMLYGARERDSGTLRVFDFDPARHSREIKKRLGVVPQENCLDENLTVFENLQIFGSYHRLSGPKLRARIDYLLDFMSLEAKSHEPVKSLSGGMQRRLVFVRALLHEPEILILDEPTTGLDPAVRHLLWQKVHELSRQGVTIILTTHYMEEAQKLCRRLVIMNEGRVATEGTPEALVQKFCPGSVVLFERAGISADVLDSWRRDSNLEVFIEPLHILLRALSLDHLKSLVDEEGLKPILFRPSNLEDVFLKITGKELRDGA
jgi:lipooligosaccharide transport system ATP-binding protein